MDNCTKSYIRDKKDKVSISFGFCGLFYVLEIVIETRNLSVN